MYKYSVEQVKEMALSQGFEVIEISSPKVLSKVTLRHLSCGYTTQVEVRAIATGRLTCQGCGGYRAKPYSQDEITEKMFKLVGDEYTLLGEYSSNHSKVLVRHNVCGKSWEVSMNDFLRRGVRCPFCRSSKGEKALERVLSSMGVRFERQKVFEDLQYKQKLRFDFYLPDHNSCIEVDGIWHIAPYRYKFDSISLKNFTERRLKDSLKDGFCLEKGLKLLRIPYYSFKRSGHLVTHLSALLEGFLYPDHHSPEEDKKMILEALEISKLSGCYKTKVGALIACKGEIVSTGYNYPVNGATPCSELGYCYKRSLGVDSGDSHCPVLHAEEIALTQASKFGVPFIGATLYCTHKPCLHCTKMIISSGIKRVVYLNYYNSGDLADQLAKEAGIEVVKVEI